MTIRYQRFGRPQRTQTQHLAAVPITFDDSEACRTRRGGVDAQHAILVFGHANRGIATKFMAADKCLTRLFFRPKGTFDP